MAPVNDVDEIIETEVCNRLIRLSCAKMVNSKSERGGAKLHRNLLILHLLRRARDEQKRFPMFANDSEWVEEPRFAESSMMMLHANPVPTLDTYSPSQYIDVDDEEDEMDDVDYGNADEDATHLLDLSKNHEPMHLSSSCDGLVKHEPIEFGYSTLRLAPLQYTFAGPDMYGMDETTAQQHMYSDSTSLPDLYFSEDMISSQSAIQHAKEREGMEAFATDKLKRDSGFDCLTISADTVVPPVSESGSDDEEVCSCISDDETEEDRDSVNGSFPSTTSHHRKRKTSALHLPSSCNVKKCCVEERQLTGLISVFNSGLSVVADQLLARPTASSVSSLQQTPKQINSFIHITCNPLIC
uniref:SERTA domain-containing protein n=1 Tax=Elaeophora elaphi TaxID=1147741 RepID=A0A0R3RKT0_9BILA